ncbi:MAG: FKBP-type peptidyl-prolyl cis-trans isomerase [Bacteroidetes bacterium]|nr:FKBP-type peptidyl-prolyl cis-trans isomerase [Bacteroidota bacterium]
MTFVQQNYPTATGTSSGLHYIMEQEGSGPKPNKFQEVHVHYTGSLTDGSVFDSSVKRGTPIAFPIGAGRVIAGWDEGIAMLSTGAKAKLIIPYFLAYGEQGRPPVIPAKATLIFDVELVSIK